MPWPTTAAQPSSENRPLSCWLALHLADDLARAWSARFSVLSSGILPFTSDSSSEAVKVSMYWPILPCTRVPLTSVTQSNSLSDFSTDAQTNATALTRCLAYSPSRGAAAADQRRRRHAGVGDVALVGQVAGGVHCGGLFALAPAAVGVLLAGKIRQPRRLTFSVRSLGLTAVPMVGGGGAGAASTLASGAGAGAGGGLFVGLQADDGCQCRRYRQCGGDANSGLALHDGFLVFRG